MRKWYRRGFQLRVTGKPVPLWVDGDGNKLYKDGNIYKLIIGEELTHQLKSHVLSNAKKEAENLLK